MVKDESVRPVVLVSRCIGFDHCRWNGGIVASPFIEKLKKCIDFITVCPEADSGLGIPRKPVRLVKQGFGTALLQQTTDLDITADMITFTEKFLASLHPIDGFLYKGQSPSCGISNVKIYADTKKGAAVDRKGSGIFGAAFKNAFPFLPVASEGHLYNFGLREHFYTQIYTLARYRSVRDNPSMKNLVTFHTNHTFILMRYNQEILCQLEDIRANHEHRDARVVCDEYYVLLCKALARPPEVMATVNVLMYAMEHFSSMVTSSEKQFYLELLEQYRQKKIPLSTCNAVSKSWIVRFDDHYFASQLFFSPYPQDLVELYDSGK